MATEVRRGTAVLLVAILAVAAASMLPAILATHDGGTLDPCTGTLRATTKGEHVCLDGSTIAVAPDDASDAKRHVEHNTTFVRFAVQNEGKFVVAQDGTGDALELELVNWTDLLPSDAVGSKPTPDGPIARMHLLTPMAPRWERNLEDRDLGIQAPLGNNWFLVNISDADTSALSSLDYVETFAPLDPDRKIQAALDHLTGKQVVHVIAMPRAPGSLENAAEAVDEHGGNVTDTSPGPGVLTAEIDAANVSDLAREPSVLWIEPAANETSISLDEVQQLTGVSRVRDSANTATDYDGAGVTALVSDTRLDTDHAELESSLSHVHSAADPLCPGDGTCDEEDFKHGTQAFGVLFGDGDHLDSRIEGMAPAATGVFRKAEIKSNLERGQPLQHAAEGHGATVASYSWGHRTRQVSGAPDPGAYSVYAWEMDNATWATDVFAVQAMANNDVEDMSTEAAAKNPAAVGGLWHKDTSGMGDDDAWIGDCYGSEDCASVGPTADGRIKPDLVGPYEQVLTSSTSFTEGNDLAENFGGTSAATPVVAGTAILAQEMYAEGVFSDGDGGATQGLPSDALTKALLVASGDSYAWDQYQLKAAGGQLKQNEESSPDRPRDSHYMRDVQGWGVPKVDEIHEDGRDLVTAGESQNLITGSVYGLEYDLDNDADKLVVSLAWSEPPTAPFANQLVSNDLDLVVEAPDGTVYVGNHGLENDTRSNPSDLKDVIVDADRRNNVENVQLTIDQTGTWTIKVLGVSVDVDADPSTEDPDQPFGLAVRPIVWSGSGGGGAVDEFIDEPAFS